MKIPRKCKTCEKKFSAIKETQYFCSRRCFKRDYYLRNKALLAAQERNPRFPTRTCELCRNTSQLPFDPMKTPNRFGAWKCPYCGLSNKILNQYVENPRSMQIVTQILVSTLTLGQSQSAATIIIS